MCISIGCINSVSSIGLKQPGSLKVELVMELVQSPELSNNESSPAWSGKGLDLQTYKRKAEDDKFLEVMFKLTDIVELVG